MAFPLISGSGYALYTVKDPVARAALAGGMQFIIAWNGNSVPVVAAIPDAVTVQYQGVLYPGTLTPDAAHAAHPIAFWLVSNGGDGNEGFAEYVPVLDITVTPNVWRWEIMGNMMGIDLSSLGALAYQDSVLLLKGDGVDVIGKDATLKANPSQVSFEPHTKDKVLGEDTTFNVSVPTTTATKKALSVDINVGLNTSNTDFVTGIKPEGTGANDTKMAEVLGANTPIKKKVKKATLRGVTGRTTNASATVTKAKRKMKRVGVDIPGSAIINDSNPIILADKSNLDVTTINECNGTSTVNGVAANGVDRRKMVTDTFSKVTKPAATVADPRQMTKNLKIHMYDNTLQSTDAGYISGADEETLVVEFDTSRELELSDASTRFATGSLLQDGASGSQAHTDYMNEQGGEVTHDVTTESKNIVTGTKQTSVATGRIDDRGTGDGLVVDIKHVDIAVSVPSQRVTFLATGELSEAANGSYPSGDNTPSGDTNEFIADVSATVPVPATDSSTTDVLIPEVANNDASGSDVSNVAVVTDFDNAQVKKVYEDIKLNKGSALTGANVDTQEATVKYDGVAAGSNDKVVTDIGSTGSASVTADKTSDPVEAITALGAATAAAQAVSFDNKDIKKVALYSDLQVQTSKSQGTEYIYEEYELSNEEVAIAVYDNVDEKLKFVPLRYWSMVSLSPDRYTLKPYVRFHRGKNGRSVVMHAQSVSGIWAGFNRYRLYCDTTAHGGFEWSVTINGTAKSGVVRWAAGDTLDSIVEQMQSGAVATYLVFSHESGENFIRVRKGGYSNSVFTLTNPLNATLEDLSLYTKVNGELQGQAHRDWQSQDVETMFPDLGFVAANTAQYSVSGYNLSYMCGGNETKYKDYYAASGSSTYLAETAVSSRMNRAAFAAMNGSGVAEQQALYDKYDGSWDAYMEASMVALDDTHTGGIEYKSYDNGDTQTSILASITTMDFDGTYIPAYPAAANCRNFTDSLVYGEAFNMSTQHEIGVFMRDAKFEEINHCLDILSAAGITVNKLSRTAYYWSVARYSSVNAWLYSGYSGRLLDINLYNTYSVRPLAYLN